MRKTENRCEIKLARPDFVLVLLFVLFLQVSFGQLVTSKNLTPLGLVQNVLLGPGVSISNVTFTGSNNSIGYFDGSKSNIGIAKGIVMTTGTIFGKLGPVGPNDDLKSGTDNGADGFSLLTNLVGKSTYNASVLEFDFIPMSDTVRFKYVFGSEEYPEYVGTEFNDVFGFFITGANPFGAPYQSKNIAIIPGSNLPVSINNVNSAKFSYYYVDNTGGKSVQYDGFTKVLEAVAAVNCGQTYHLVIAVGDVNDSAYDSGIFLQANSLSAKPQLEVDFSLNKELFGDSITLAEGCTNVTFEVSKSNSAINKKFDIPIVVRGSCAVGVDYSNTVPAVLTINPGVKTNSFTVNILRDFITDSLDSVIFDIMLPDPCGNYIKKTFLLYIKNVDDILIQLNDTSIKCKGDLITLSPIVTGGVSPYEYKWKTGENTQDISVSPSITRGYELTVNDICLNVPVKKNVIVTIPEYKPLALLDIANFTDSCPKKPIIKEAFPLNGGGIYSYEWTDGVSVLGNAKSINLSALYSTIFSVEVKDQCGDSVSKSFEYIIYNAPLYYSIKGRPFVCEGDTVSLSVRPLGGIGAYTYEWKPIGIFDSKVVVKPTNGMSYTISVGDACKTYTIDKTITIKTVMPRVDFNTKGISTGEDVFFYSLVDPSVVSFGWNFGNGYFSSLKDSKSFYQDSGRYLVKLTIMDTLGCVNFIEKWINLYYPSIVYIPNAFSPDDNGVNDFFFPNLMSVKELDFAIFNRWGQRIFYAKDVRSKWDGTYNGVLCPEDVYIYKIKTVSVLGIKNEYVGHVTLYRNEF